MSIWELAIKNEQNFFDIQYLQRYGENIYLAYTSLKEMSSRILVSSAERILLGPLCATSSTSDSDSLSS